MRALRVVLGDAEWLQLAGAVARGALRMLRHVPRGVARRLAGAWGAGHALPDPPARSFRDWYRQRGSGGE